MNETFVELVRDASNRVHSHEAHEALEALAKTIEEALAADDARRGIPHA